MKRSVFRSLRWIIESAVFWADVELDKKINDAISHFTDYYRNVSLSEENYSFQSEYIPHYNRAHLDDRLYMKEKNNGRPGFGESVNNLNIFKKDGMESLVKTIEDELKTLYHDFSAFTHISVESLRRSREHPDNYPYSMDYAYDREKFYSTLEKLWKVIDLVAPIMLLMSSRFYRYKLPHQYLNATRTHFKKRRYNPTDRLICHISPPTIKNRMGFSRSLLGIHGKGKET